MWIDNLGESKNRKISASYNEKLNAQFLGILAEIAALIWVVVGVKVIPP